MALYTRPVVFDSTADRLPWGVVVGHSGPRFPEWGPPACSHTVKVHLLAYCQSAFAREAFQFQILAKLACLLTVVHRRGRPVGRPCQTSAGSAWSPRRSR